MCHVYHFVILKSAFISAKTKKPYPTVISCKTRLTNKKDAQSRNRTSDTRIFSPLLYQLSYLGICSSGFFILPYKVAGTGFEPATSGL